MSKNNTEVKVVDVNVYDEEEIIENCFVEICDGYDEEDVVEDCTVRIIRNGIESEQIENCTAQIWRNSITGKTSVGWWRNTKCENNSQMIM